VVGNWRRTLDFVEFSCQGCWNKMSDKPLESTICKYTAHKLGMFGWLEKAHDVIMANLFVRDLTGFL
jgi:hypothetical protein